MVTNILKFLQKDLILAYYALKIHLKRINYNMLMFQIDYMMRKLKKKIILIKSTAGSQQI